MPNNITFTFTWCEAFQKGIPKGFFALKPDPVYHKTMKIYLNKLTEYQKNKGELKEQKARFEYYYQKRSDVQNRLYWSLRTIQANEMNAGKKGKGMVTAEQLHEDYLKEYGEREIIITQRKNLSRYLTDYRVESVVVDLEKIPIHEFLERKIQIDDREYIKIQFIRGTSKMNTKEMALVIEQVFDEIWETGVEESGDIHNYWVEWSQYLNDNKIVLHDEMMSREQYKAKKKMCEACGSNPGQQLAHIQAVGMGGKEEFEKNHPSNWLHLCNDCHIEDSHRTGWNDFMKRFKHLRYKIKTALNRDYSDLKGE